MNGIEWKHNTPVSKKFGDIYFNPQFGRQESEYVFLDGINLSAFLESNQEFLSIFEFGFGTGLNFFLTWERQRKLAPNKPLIFFSVEKYPLTKEEILRSLRDLVPEVLLTRFIKQYNYIFPGLHVFRFDQVQLRLFIGEALEGLESSWGPIHGWYLDGFSPAKNPDMWRKELFDQAVTLSAKGARLATFTSAGFVRRALLEAGFIVKKTAGYGFKKERLIGHLEKSNLVNHWKIPATPYKSTIIAGAGLAGSFATMFLAKNQNIQVYDPVGIASGASGNPIGLIYPPIFRANSPISSFFLQGYFSVLRLLETSFPDHIIERGLKLIPTVGGTHSPEKLEEAQNYMPWAFIENNNETWIPSAMIVSPAKLVATILDKTSVIQETAPFHLKNNFIFANGHEVGKQLPQLNISPSRGQLNWAKVLESIPIDNQLKKFYTVQWQESNQNFIALGSSYKLTLDTSFQLEEARVMIRDSILPNDMINLNWQGRASIRPVSCDRLPVIGPLTHPNSEKIMLGQYVLSGSGSRGLISLPLGGMLLSDIMSGLPPGVSKKVWRFIEPVRFYRRFKKKN